MKRKLKTTGILLISLVMQALGQNIPLSLHEAINEGLKNNHEVQNAGIETRKSQSHLSEQQAGLYPQVEAFSNFDYYFGIPKLTIPGEIFGQEGKLAVEFGSKYDWTSGFRATQVLYNQSYFTSLKIARCHTKIEQLNLQQKKEELVYQVSQVYYLCLATSQQKKHLSVTVENMDELLKIARLRQENGVILKADYEQVLVDQNNLLTEIDNLEQLYQQQLNLLKFLTGIGVNAKVELTDSLTVMEEPDTREPVWKSLVEIKKLDSGIETTQLSLKMNRQQYLPKLSVVTQYYYEAQQDEFNFFDGNDRFFKVGFVGLSLSIPIFDGFEKRAKIHQQKFALQQLQNSRTYALNYFSKEYKDAKLQYENNRTAVARQEENIRIAEENYRVALLNYRQQTISLTDLLRTQNSLTDALLSHDNALLQLKNAELDLIKSKGEILDEVNQ